MSDLPDQQERIRPESAKAGPYSSVSSNRRIAWARGLSDQDIADLIQMKLLEARADRVSQVSLLNELAHEIKFRLAPKGGHQRKNVDA